MASFRVRFFKGKCLGTLNGTAVQAVFCDPNRRQSFSFTESGSLKLQRTGQCLQKADTSIFSSGHLLKFSDCDRALKFKMVKGTFMQLINYDRHAYVDFTCLTPVKIEDSMIKKMSNPKLGDLVGLMPCDKDFSNITLLDDKVFMRKRKFLIQPSPPRNSTCDYPSCALNKRAPPVKLLPPDQIRRCHNLADCVTVVTKTARRPHLVTRLAQSIRDVKGYDLPMVAMDDGGEPYSQEIKRMVSQYKNLKYIISDNEDLGIAEGRTLAVKQVKTKYFLLLDDDSVVSNQTDIELLTQILDTTDASLVGGKVADSSGGFASILHFGYSPENGRRRLTLYRGACPKLNETIENFPECMRCDVTTNVFMAKTKDILEVGGWSEELKIMEHKDLFLRLKAAHKKVVYCPEFQIYNEKERKKDSPSDDGGVYRKKRFGRFALMKAMLANIWNVDEVGETYFRQMPDGARSEI